MKKTFILLVVALVLSMSSSAWGIYLDIWSTEAKVGVYDDNVASISLKGYESYSLLTMKVNYSIIGALPPGLKLEGSDYTFEWIGGTPKKAGVYDFTVTATVKDTKNPLVYDYAEAPCTITIVEADSSETTEKTTNNNDGNLGSSGGGGCETGLGIIGLMFLGIASLHKVKH